MVLSRIVVGIGLLLTPAFLSAQPAPLVSAGGTVTEIVFALGQESRLAGVDASSLYPEKETSRLPQVGYVRSLSAEGVLSLGPRLLLTTVDAGPPAVLDQIRSAGVPVSVVPSGSTWETARERITFVAEVLGVPEKGRALAAEFDRQRARAEAVVGRRQAAPRVLFLYSRGAGTLMVSGTGTEAAAVIALAGGTNAVTGYSGYRPLTPEALAAAHPDVILMTTRGLEASGGIRGLGQVPGFAAASGSARVVALDDLLLLGFGPRLPQAVLELEALWPRPSR